MQAGGRAPSPTGQLPVINPQFSFPQSTSQTTPLDAAIQELDLYKRSGTNVGPELIQQTAAQYNIPLQALMSRFGIQTPSEMTPPNSFRGMPTNIAASSDDTNQAMPETGSVMGEAVTAPPTQAMPGTGSAMGEAVTSHPIQTNPYEQLEQARAGAFTGAGQPTTEPPAPVAGIRTVGKQVVPTTQFAPPRPPVVAAPGGGAQGGAPVAGGEGGVGGLPSFADMMRRNSALFPDTTAPLREELRNSRTNPAREREEARNMALLQAGLAIAGGTSPHFAQNLAGAIPAIQGYQQQSREINKARREEIRDEIKAAEHELTRMKAAGEITAHEFTAASHMLLGDKNNAAAMARQVLQTSATLGAASMHESGANARHRETLTSQEKREETQANRPTDLRRNAEFLFTAAREAGQPISMTEAIARAGGGENSLQRRQIDALNGYNTQYGNILSRYNTLIERAATSGQDTASFVRQREAELENVRRTWVPMLRLLQVPQPEQSTNTANTPTLSGTFNGNPITGTYTPTPR
jgi:hypothetical protein